MDIYFYGWLLTALIGLGKLRYFFSLRSGTQARNFKKIWFYYSPLGGQFDSEHPTSVRVNCLVVIYLLLLVPLFSWAAVANFCYQCFRWHTSQFEHPYSVRALAYRLKYIDLNPIDVQEIVEKIALELGGEDAARQSRARYEERLEMNSFKIFKQNKPEGSGTGVEAEALKLNELKDQPGFPRKSDPNSFLISNDDWFSEISIDPKNKTFSWDSRPSDWLSSFRKHGEYRLEGGKVLVRTIFSSAKHAGEDEEFRIKDGVVLEWEMREPYRRRAEEGKWLQLNESLEHQIADHLKEVEWHELNRLDVRLFVLKCHPEHLSNSDFIKLVRREMGWLNQSIHKAKSFANEIGLCLIEEENGYEFKQVVHDQLKIQIPNVKEDKLCHFDDDFRKAKIGLSIIDLSRAKDSLKIYQRNLGERNAA